MEINIKLMRLEATHRPNSVLTLRSNLGGNGPHEKQEARAHSNKTLKEAIILGCISQSRVPAARFLELLSLPLAVGKIKLFLRN